MSTVPIAHGWTARQALNAQPPNTSGNRIMLFGQTAIFQESFVTASGDNDDQAVTVAKWLVNGESSGTVWVSDYLTDLTYWVAGATSTVEVGATVRSALTTAGFTVSASTSPADLITYPAFDIAIVGRGESFGTTLGGEDNAGGVARGNHLRDFVAAGGGLMLINSYPLPLLSYTPYSAMFQYDPYFLGGSGWLNPGENTPTTVAATALNPTLFPAGKTIHRKRSFRINLVGVATSAFHQIYNLDGYTNPNNQYVNYSAFGDA